MQVVQKEKRAVVARSRPNQRREGDRGYKRGGARRGGRRGHLCAAPALLPVLLLQLCVLHSQLEAGQLGHERLVTHMERVRDGELRTEKGRVKGGGGGGG